SIMITIGIIEQNNTLRRNLVHFLNGQPGFRCALDAPKTDHFFEQAGQEARFHVVLHQFDGKRETSAKEISRLKKTWPDTEVIILSQQEDSDTVMKAFYAGATGYLTKGTPLTRIKEAIEETHQGRSAISPSVARRLVEHFAPRKTAAQAGVELTPKENQLVQCLVHGLSYKLAADQLSVSINTVLYHVRNLYRKLGVNSKSEVVAMRLRGEC
ncbi:MAG: response regulator transcription factor, partial [Lewinella sp.]|nr:response regulator transcription factor [Lewinella sp.]